MKRFKLPRQVQRFLAVHDQLANSFTCRRNHQSASQYRAARARAFHAWNEVTAAHMAA